MKFASDGQTRAGARRGPTQPARSSTVAATHGRASRLRTEREPAGGLLERVEVVGKRHVDIGRDDARVGDSVAETEAGERPGLGEGPQDDEAAVRSSSSSSDRRRRTGRRPRRRRRGRARARSSARVPGRLEPPGRVVRRAEEHDRRARRPRRARRAIVRLASSGSTRNSSSRSPETTRVPVTRAMWECSAYVGSNTSSAGAPRPAVGEQEALEHLVRAVRADRPGPADAVVRRASASRKRLRLAVGVAVEARSSASSLSEHLDEAGRRRLGRLVRVQPDVDVELRRVVAGLEHDAVARPPAPAIPSRRDRIGCHLALAAQPPTRSTHRLARARRAPRRSRSRPRAGRPGLMASCRPRSRAHGGRKSSTPSTLATAPCRTSGARGSGPAR